MCRGGSSAMSSSSTGVFHNDEGYCVRGATQRPTKNTRGQRTNALHPLEVSDRGDGGLTRFVEKEFRGFLTCRGVPAHGLPACGASTACSNA
jgi:hypothetical protein